jgi:hypothetical protein
MYFLEICEGTFANDGSLQELKDRGAVFLLLLEHLLD